MLVAIRENEQRARFVGYPTNRYKLIGFVLSAVVVALAGTLSVFNHRFASAEPLAVAFSGELIAMVVIGGMRSFLGPALGALFFILFREFLSIWTPHWLFYFGLLFVGFIVFSPSGLVGVAERLIAPFRKRVALKRRQWPGASLPHKRNAAADLSRVRRERKGRRWWHATWSNISAEFMRSTARLDGARADVARPDWAEWRRQDHGIQSPLWPFSA